MAKLDAFINCETYLHYRPSNIIVLVCQLFQNTKFTITRKIENIDNKHRKFNPKVYLELVDAKLKDEEMVEIVTFGKSELLAATILKSILENMRELFTTSEKMTFEETGELLYKVVAISVENINDPFRHKVLKKIGNNLFVRQKQNDDLFGPFKEVVLKLGGRLHGAPVEILPKIAIYFNCRVILQFEIKQELFDFDISEDSSWVKFDLLAFSPPYGTKIIIKAYGTDRAKCAHYISGMLIYLAYIDHWIRNSITTRKDMHEIITGIQNIVDNPPKNSILIEKIFPESDSFITDILKKEMIFSSDSIEDKMEALEKIVKIHCDHTGIDFNSLLTQILLVEEQVSLYLNGVVIQHAKLFDDCPNISLSIGIFPNGIKWTKKNEIVNLVFLLVAATEAPNTYLSYLKQTCQLVKENPKLISTLKKTYDEEEVTKLIKFSEIQRSTFNQSKILLIESIKDETTLSRHQILKESPRSKSFNLDSFYAIEDESKQNVPENLDFIKRLEEKIISFQPDYILVHTGWFFFQNPSIIYSAVRTLKATFPKIRFGFQERKDLAVEPYVFDEDEYTLSIQNIIFKDILRI